MLRANYTNSNIKDPISTRLDSSRSFKENLPCPLEFWRMSLRTLDLVMFVCISVALHDLLIFLYRNLRIKGTITAYFLKLATSPRVDAE